MAILEYVTFGNTEIFVGELDKKIRQLGKNNGFENEFSVKTIFLNVFSKLSRFCLVGKERTLSPSNFHVKFICHVVKKDIIFQ